MAYTPEERKRIQDRICEQLMMGLPMTKVLKEDGMPSRNTVVTWLRNDEEFKKAYEWAREVQLDFLADEVMEISDDGSGDIVHFPDGSKKFDSEHYNRSKLRVESRKWLLGVMRPDQFGQKVKQEVKADVKTEVKLDDEGKLNLAKWIAFNLTEVK